MAVAIAKWVIDEIVQDGDLDSMCQVIDMTTDSLLGRDVLQCAAEHVYQRAMDDMDGEDARDSARAASGGFCRVWMDNRESFENYVGEKPTPDFSDFEDRARAHKIQRVVNGLLSDGIIYRIED